LTVSDDKQEFERLLGNATLIVDVRLAGLKDGLLDDTVSDPPLTADGGNWLGEGAIGFRVRRIESSAAVTSDTSWHERFRLACEVSEDGEPTRWLAVDKWRNDATTEDDRSEGAPQLLEEHQTRTEQRARGLAKSLGLSDDHENALAPAARLHDEGKRAVRWQRAFNAPSNGIYAKTEGPSTRACSTVTGTSSDRSFASKRIPVSAIFLRSSAILCFTWSPRIMALPDPWWGRMAARKLRLPSWKTKRLKSRSGLRGCRPAGALGDSPGVRRYSAPPIS
jgi:hypothetical protein